MAVYKKALPFLLAFALASALLSCGGEDKSTGDGSIQTESSTPSSGLNDTQAESSSGTKNSNQSGGAWPDNEFTRQIPDPGFEVHSVTVSSDSCSITFSRTTTKQLKEYAGKVQDAGFTAILTRETELRGVSRYLFTAKNAADYEIILTKSVGHSILTINKLG